MEPKPAVIHSLTPAPLEQFILLSKSAKGAAAAELIHNVLEAPGVYVFAEILEMPNIKELENNPAHQPYLNLMKLFAYGTYRDYLQNKASLPELNPAQTKKLKHLTLVSHATRSKCIPYTRLLDELGISNVRELEDVIIEAIYADIIRGKLDQKNSQLEVDYAIGRDIRPTDLGPIANTLEKWCQSCDMVMAGIENQIAHANSEKMKYIKQKENVEQELVNIKKTLKTQMHDGDDPMYSDSRDSIGHSEKSAPRKCKSKLGTRATSSTKFWHK